MNEAEIVAQAALTKVNDLEHRQDMSDAQVESKFAALRVDIAHIVSAADKRIRPLEKLCYGLVALVMSAVVMALVAIAVRATGSGGA